jgi:hypothetical protein
LLNRQQQPYPNGGDRERIVRARQAAEELFTAKPESSGSLSDPPLAEQTARKPRVLRVIPPAAPVPAKELETPISPEPRTTGGIPPSQFGRIRSWVKYGMTVAQVAKVYGVAASDIERILQQA